MEEVLDKIQQLTNQFGKTIIADTSFVYMFNDLYPSRNNPSVSHILKSIVSDGHSASILMADKKNLPIIVDNAVSSLVFKYGYDKSQARELMMILAIATDVIPYSEYKKGENTSLRSGANSFKKTRKPSDSKPLPPSKDKTIPTQSSPTNYLSLMNSLLMLALWIMTLFATPFAYAILTRYCSPFLSALLVGIVNIIVYVGSFLIISNRFLKPFFSGALSAIIVCSILFFLCGPYILGTYKASLWLGYFGIHHKAVTPSVFTFLWGVCYPFAVTPFVIFISEVNTIGSSYFFTPWMIQQFSNKIWTKGFIYTFLIIILISSCLVAYPSLKKTHDHKKRIIHTHAMLLKNNINNDSSFFSLIDYLVT